MMAPPAALEDLQLALQRHVLDAPSDIAACIRPDRGLEPARRLDIYRHAYRARLAEALRDSYGHTAAYLGTEAFARLAGDYVEAQPSRHRNLRWYGASFAPWLRLGGRAAPEVAELAALDWALRRAFDGPDCVALGLADLAAIAPEAWPAMRLQLQPTVERVRFAHNTVALWHALDTGQPAPAAARLPEENTVLVWRRGLQPHFRSLGPFEDAALDLVAAASPFGAACEALAERFPGADVVRETGTLLRRWVDEELLAAGDWSTIRS